MGYKLKLGATSWNPPGTLFSVVNSGNDAGDIRESFG